MFNKKDCILFLFTFTWKTALSICGSSQGIPTCCSGSFWNKDKSKCEKCPLGFHSFNCSVACKFPSFGDDCQYLCNCSESSCDHRFGCNKFSEDIPFNETIYILNKTSERLFPTTQSFTEIPSSGLILAEQGVPFTILYIIIVLVCVFIILFALFVGIYFYKHCMKQSIITDETGKTRLDLNEGYKCLNQLETIQTIDNLRDSTYLEPAFDERFHYNEIENHEEINEPGISVDLMKKQNKEILQLCHRSKSCNLHMHVPSESIAADVKINLCTNSL